jgi:REP element-mobilizing transposase RayT
MKPHAKRLRHGRASERYRIYLCTTVVGDRRTVFADFRTGLIVVDTLRWQDDQRHTRTLAFVVMPDHLHWLFELCGDTHLSLIMQSMKKHSARRVNASMGLQGPLWQPGFHDHAVRREEDLRALARYVISNPVRAGLVRSIRDYPLWDAMWLM